MTLGRIAAFAILAGMMMTTACMTTPATTATTPPTGGMLNLPAAHTQSWLDQIPNGALPPGFYPGQSGSILNTVESVAADAVGNVLIGGYNAAKFSGDPSIAWTEEAFIGKFDPTGKLIWLKQFGTTSGFDSVVSVLVDSQGNVYACGTTTGAFQGYSNPLNQLNLMIAKLTPDGSLQWVQQYPTNLLPLAVEGAVLTPSGTIAFWGMSQGMSAGVGNTSFIQAIDPAAQTTLWQKQYAGSNYPEGITVDKAGNMVAIGESQGTFPGTPGATSLPFAIKVDGGSGTVVWLQQLTEYATTHNVFIGLFGVSQDANGDVILGGASTQAGNQLCAGLCLTKLENNQDAFVAKLSGADGSIVWTHDYGTGHGDGVTAVAATSSNYVYAVGFTGGVMSSAFAQPTDNIFALKFDSAGTVQWVQQFGDGPWIQGPTPARGLQAATSPLGELLIGAETEGAFPGNSNSTGVSEIFVAKFGG